MVCAYIMKYLNYTMKESFRHIQQRRPSAILDKMYEVLLQKYEDELKTRSNLLMRDSINKEQHTTLNDKISQGIKISIHYLPSIQAVKPA